DSKSAGMVLAPLSRRLERVGNRLFDRGIWVGKRGKTEEPHFARHKADRPQTQRMHASPLQRRALAIKQRPAAQPTMSGDLIQATLNEGADGRALSGRCDRPRSRAATFRKHILLPHDDCLWAPLQARDLTAHEYVCQIWTRPEAPKCRSNQRYCLGAEWITRCHLRSAPSNPHHRFRRSVSHSGSVDSPSGHQLSDSLARVKHACRHGVLRHPDYLGNLLDRLLVVVD